MASGLALGWPGEDPLVARGFDHFYNLEYDEGIADFRQYILQHPDDPNGYNHLAQTVLYREMYRTGALESELVSGTNAFLRRDKMQPSAADQKQFDDAIATAMRLAQQKLAQNPNDIGALYALGVSYGLRCNYTFLVRKAWVDSLRDATMARKQHARILELDPNFVDARLAQGGFDYILGSLPWAYRMLGFITGMHGDRERGIKTLQGVAEHGKMNRTDASVILAAIYRRERRPREAIDLLVNRLIPEMPRNFLLRLELVQMYGDLGDKQAALKVLDEVERLRASGAAGYARLLPEKIDYTRGNLLFWYNDFDPALRLMKKAAAKAGEMDLQTEQMAWLRLGQIHDMRGERKEAVAAYQQAILCGPQSEAAHYARDYVGSRYHR